MISCKKIGNRAENDALTPLEPRNLNFSAESHLIRFQFSMRYANRRSLDVSTPDPLKINSDVYG
jgi:hypothetical protein